MLQKPKDKSKAKTTLVFRGGNYETIVLRVSRSCLCSKSFRPRLCGMCLQLDLLRHRATTAHPDSERLGGVHEQQSRKAIRAKNFEVQHSGRNDFRRYAR